MAAGAKFHGPYVSTGEEVGTGAAMLIQLDYKPIRIEINNRTRNVIGAWTAAMPDASAQLLVDSGAGTSDVSFITTNGITPGSNGFTLGSNASLNTASDVIYWTAYRSFR